MQQKAGNWQASWTLAAISLSSFINSTLIM